ncbi:hypothetical protein SteCoe_32036 [Stentor coeruleus]|uniref:Senescence domain-containing protein n=1 Tax=Stentor coeruleus TaxID=5963 RepID=A0A1R2AZV4_9CILI|nr:hypothetical protein SteCoe_32036 [Stentor coeruleus]
MESKNFTSGFTSFLDKAGSITRSGLVSGAKVLAKGIDKTSELLKKNTVEHTEKADIKILPQIETASKTTSFIIENSQKLLGKAVNKTFNITEKAWNSMPESEAMKKFRQHKAVKIGLEVGKAGAGAGINIIGGLSEGLSLITDSSVKATINIVDHKYGENAAKATKETFNIASDMIGAYQMSYKTGILCVSAAQAMKAKEEEEKENESKIISIMNSLFSITI